MKAPARGARVWRVMSFMDETNEIPSSAVSLNKKSARLQCRPAAHQGDMQHRHSDRSNCNRTCHGSAPRARAPGVAPSPACCTAAMDALLRFPNVDMCRRNIQRDRDTNRRKPLQSLAVHLLVQVPTAEELRQKQSLCVS